MDNNWGTGRAGGGLDIPGRSIMQSPTCMSGVVRGASKVVKRASTRGALKAMRKAGTQGWYVLTRNWSHSGGT